MKAKLISLVVAFAVVACVGVNAQNNNNSEKNQTELQKDSVYYTCSMHPEIRSAVPGNCPKCGMELIKQSNSQENQHKMKMKCGMMNGMDDMKNDSSKKQVSVVYTCSMHPEVTSDKPGNCPKCGMNLVKQTTSEGKKENQHKMKMKCGMM